MQRKTFAASLPPLAMLALTILAPGHCLAGPPEGPSGRMVLAPDEVGDGLRKYWAERDEGARIWLLSKLARSRDPRVGIALGEALGDTSYLGVRAAAAYAILYHHIGWQGGRPGAELAIESASEWWKENKADLRRRAKGLPR